MVRSAGYGLKAGQLKTSEIKSKSDILRTGTGTLSLILLSDRSTRA